VDKVQEQGLSIQRGGFVFAHPGGPGPRQALAILERHKSGQTFTILIFFLFLYLYLYLFVAIM
jgi:hypothetical protein